MTKRSDADKERSPYFDHWQYSRGTLGRVLGFGDKKAIYKPVLEGHVVKALETDDEDATAHILAAFNDGALVLSGAKTVRPERWWLEFAEGQHNTIADLYKKSAWAYRCVQIRADTLAQIPWHVVVGEDEVEDALFELLADVNPESNWGELIAATESDLNIYGSAFWRKVRNKNMDFSGGGQVQYLQRLNPESTRVIVKGAFVDHFEYGQDNRVFAREDVVYFHLYNPTDDLLGLSPLEVCRKAIEIEVAADDHMASFFENRAMPSYIFSMETQDQNELRRLARTWNEMYKGKGKQFQTAFVGGGAEPKEMGYSPSDLALSEVRQEARKAICGALGVPPVLVGAWEAANYATAEEQRQGLYTEAIIPRCEYIASVVNAELAGEFGEGEFEWDYANLAALQEDAEQQANRIATLVREKIIKPEVAAVELGYEEGDVPEPAPIPEQLQPFAGQENDEDEQELEKWRKKVLRRLKAGRKPAVAFRSEVLDQNLVNTTLGMLEDCQTPEDVDRVFVKAKLWKPYP